MVANILPTDPPKRWVGIKCQNSKFSEYGYLAYQIKRNHKCSNMVANILPADPLPGPGVRAKGQNSNFSEHGHVAYQTKWNNKYSNIVPNILHADPHPPYYPLDPWDEVKIQLFQNMVLLHIKLNIITNATT